MTIAVILNPTSGRGTGTRRRAELERLLAASAHGAAWRIIETTGPGSAATLAAQAAADGAGVVAGAGGDGTCGEVVNGLVGTRAKLGILPLGTGNDFARCLGLGTDLALAVRTLFEGTPRPLDLGRVGERWFLNVAGCGFDAVAAQRINRGFRHLRGTPAYIAATLQTLCDFRPVAWRLTLDGQTHETRALLIAVANATGYGGGMRIAPDARIDDGLFDVCTIGDVGRLEFLRAFPSVFKGTHVTHPKVTLHRARRVRIASDPPLPVLADGEIIGTTPVEFELVPHAIEVLGPN